MNCGQLLESKFNAFVEEIKPIVNDVDTFLEDMQNIDYIEVLQVVLFLFPDDRTGYHLDQLLELKQIELTSDQKDGLIPIIKKYVTFLEKIKSHLDL